MPIRKQQRARRAGQIDDWTGHVFGWMRLPIVVAANDDAGDAVVCRSAMVGRRIGVPEVLPRADLGGADSPLRIERPSLRVVGEIVREVDRAAAARRP